MEFNVDPYEKWFNLQTAEPTSYKGYDGLFSFCKSTSNYHFDDTVDDADLSIDPPAYIPICQFDCDWADEVEINSPLATEATFEYRTQPRLDNNNNLEKNDFLRWGYNVDNDRPFENPYVILHRTRNFDFNKRASDEDAISLTPKFKKIVELFGMGHPGGRKPDTPNVKFDIQKPGNMFYWHLDNFGGLLRRQRGNYEKFAPADHDQRKLMRLVIFLEDQQQGHVWKQGNTYLTWKKGDCFTWPWRDIPHGTANFGHTPRPTLNITGSVSETTYEFLKKCPQKITIT